MRSAANPNAAKFSQSEPEDTICRCLLRALLLTREIGSVKASGRALGRSPAEQWRPSYDHTIDFVLAG